MSTTRHILIVDDDLAWRDALATALRVRGHQVLEAGTLAEARASLAAGPTLLVLDVHLPDGRSLDLAAAARLGPHAPTVVLMSGDADPDGVRALVDAGLCDFLTKPFTLDALEQLLERAA